jgi:hypothetical protein
MYALHVMQHVSKFATCAANHIFLAFFCHIARGFAALCGSILTIKSTHRLSLDPQRRELKRWVYTDQRREPLSEDMA